MTTTWVKASTPLQPGAVWDSGASFWDGGATVNDPSGALWDAHPTLWIVLPQPIAS